MSWQPYLFKLTYEEMYSKDILCPIIEKSPVDNFDYEESELFINWLISTNLQLVIHIKREEFEQAEFYKKKIRNFIRIRCKRWYWSNPTIPYKRYRELYIKENDHIREQMLQHIDEIPA